MRIALVNSTPHAKVYPLGLMKISAMLKKQGHSVKLFSCILPEPKKYDEIWISTLFTFDIPIAIALVREAKNRAKVVKVGGIAASLMPEVFRKENVDVHVGQIVEAEKMPPDYDLLEKDPDYSIVHTSRGCIRKCGFCMVHRLEPEFKNRQDWEKDLSHKTTKVRFFDNNWLAKSPKDLMYDAEKIKKLVKEKRITEFDFNQAIDCRLLTPEKADIMQGLPFKPVRFAFDGMHEDGHFQRAVKLCADRGFKEFSALMLYNFKDTPEDFYYRMRECVKIRNDNPDLNASCFPMKYQPVLDLKSHLFIGEHWTKKSLDGFKQILNQHSVFGQISPKGKLNKDRTWKLSPMSEFEYWFGKNEKEFVNLINYPNIRQLSMRKKDSFANGDTKKMANEQNLKPIKKGELTSEEAKKRGSNGGKKSVISRREKKLFSQIVADYLSGKRNLKINGKIMNVSGQEYIGEVLDRILANADMSSVMMLKTMWEATESPPKKKFDINQFMRNR